MEVWYHKHLGFNLKRKIKSSHYRALRVVHPDVKSRAELDMISERARMVQSQQPISLLGTTMKNSYSER